MRKPSRTALFPLLLLAALFLLPLGVSAKGSAPQEPSKETKSEEKTPLAIKARLDISGGRGVFQLFFSHNMWDMEKETPNSPIALEDMPFSLTPAQEGEGKWLDEKTLVFITYNALPRATTITVAPKTPLESVTGQKFAGGPFSFTPYPFYYQASQVRYAVDGTVTIETSFSCPVNLAKLKAALTVEDEKGEKLPVEIEPQKDEPNVTKVKLHVKPEKLGKVTVKLPEDFLSESGPVGLTKKRADVEVATTSMFAINTVRTSQSSSPPWERYIEIRTTNSADMDKVRQYMDITPATDVQIVARSDGFIIEGDFITRPRLSITFKKGMPGLFGALTEDFTSTVVFNDFSPRMAFDTDGVILSPNRSMRVPISSVNVEKVQATLWQLPESNIPLMAMGFFDSYKKHLSRKIAVRTGAVNGVRNRSADFSLDLTQIAGKAKGIFLLSVADASDPQKVRSDEPRSPDDYYDEYSYDDDIASPIEKLVVISDIGITARVMPDSITVWANSIATTEALRNANVRVYSTNNVLITEGRTDKDGLWRHAQNEDWANHERPAIIVVSTANDERQPKAEPGLAEASVTDIAYLKLDADLGADPSFDTGGRDYVRQGYEAFCFTPRGIFRPGETVDFKVMVRNSLMQAPEEFPVAWRVTSSTGRTVGSGTAMLSSEGGASFSLPLVPSAPTGRYSMAVFIPGQSGRPIGLCSFSVEDFQPPRIEVKLAPQKPYAVAESIAIDVDAKYLFGSPVADAPWESQISVIPRGFHHEDWRAFNFPAYFDEPMSVLREEDSGTLDETGKAALNVHPEDRWTASILDVVATVRVREDGGRWVARNLIVPWFKNAFLLGYEYPKGELKAGSPASLRLAAVTPDGKAADIKELSATIERRENYYVRSNKGYTHSTRYVPVATETVALDKGVGTLTFTPPKQASYRVSVAAGGVTALSAEISVWSGIDGSDDGASPLVDRVILSWERPRHTVGETAMLKIRSPFPGKLLLVLESEKELYRMVLPMKETEAIIPVPVMDSMPPNAYCSAWVIRPVEEGGRWGAHRAYGVIPLLIDRTDSKLNVAITAAGKILPKSEMPVSIAVTNANGAPVRGEVTLMLVDEGLLSLTNFKTPDPFSFFTAKRAMMGRAYDLYNYLMPLSSRAPIRLQAGGGAADEASRLSPMTRKLELLSIFLGSITTNNEGVAETTLKLPEYSGRGRLMAIAATKRGVGSSDGNVRIARDVTVEATVPRMVAPGDMFAVPIIAFSDGKKDIKATVTIKTDGPLEAAESQFDVTLNAENSRAAMDLTVKALDGSGMASVRVITAIEGSPDKPFEQRLEIPVRPPYPLLTKSGFGTIKGGEKAAIDVGAGFFPGTQKVALSFSDTPAIGLMKALDYLGSYPYGCLEQTTSSSWPYLAVPAMLKSIDPEKSKDSEYKQALDYAIRRILSMQRADGGFNGWPGSYSGSVYAWNSVYAMHFLTEAKSAGLVPKDAMQSALNWMRSYLSSSLPDSRYGVMDALSVKAYITYVLALNGDAPLGWMQFLREQGNYLTLSSRIFLAGAQALATGKTDALKELGTLPVSRPSRYGWSLESSPRNEALRLLMWANADPFAPETAMLAKRVMDEGNSGRWRSTQENAMAVMAMGRFMEKTAGPSRDFKATLISEADGKEIISFTNRDKPTVTRAMLLPADPEAPAPVVASVEGEGTAYYSWTTSGVPMEPPAPFAEGLQTMRRWVLPDGTVYDFIPDESGKLPEALQNLKIPHGTRITVTLYVNPEAAMNSLVLSDIVPGGFEIDNPNLVPDSEYAARAGTFIDPKTGKPFITPKEYRNAASLNTFWGGRTEMRDDRLLLFADYMPNGPAAFTYTLRAVSKGEFVLPPLSAEDMYDPTIRALTNTARVTVE